MKLGVLLIAILVAVGCSGQPAATSTSASPANTLDQKLQKMSPQDRAEYVKTHFDEVKESAGMPKIPTSAKPSGK